MNMVSPRVRLIHWKDSASPGALPARSFKVTPSSAAETNRPLATVNATPIAAGSAVKTSLIIGFVPALEWRLAATIAAPMAWTLIRIFNGLVRKTIFEGRDFPSGAIFLMVAVGLGTLF